MSAVIRDISLCEALVKLDRKVSRALNNGVGINLSSSDLQLMALIGIPSIIANAKAKALEELARSRRSEEKSSAANSAAEVGAQGASRGEMLANQLFGSSKGAR